MVDEEQDQYAHLWTASLVFVGLEVLAVVGAVVAIAFRVGRR